MAFDTVLSLTSESSFGSQRCSHYFAGMQSEAQQGERILLYSSESRKGCCSFGVGALTSSASPGLWQEGSLPPRVLLANLQKRFSLPVTLQIARKQIINHWQFSLKQAMIVFTAQKYSRAQRNPIEATECPRHALAHTHTHTRAAHSAHPSIQKGSGRVSQVRTHPPSLSSRPFLSLVL